MYIEQDTVSVTESIKGNFLQHKNWNWNRHINKNRYFMYYLNNHIFTKTRPVFDVAFALSLASLELIYRSLEFIIFKSLQNALTSWTVQYIRDELVVYLIMK